MKITIKDIARLSDVSIATVSKIINRKDQDISEATREKVLQVMEEHNYIPNTVARSLVTKKTKTIGLVIPDIRNPFFPELARGAEDKANEEGYNVIFCNTDDVLEKEERYIDMMIEKMVDGIIFTASSKRMLGLDHLKLSAIPIVVVDRDISFKGVKGRVVVDNRKGAYMAVKHLTDCGYRHIVFISGPLTNKPDIERWEGCKEALGELGVPEDKILIFEGNYKSGWGYEAVKLLLEKKIPFDGIFCGDDLIAIGAMKGLKEEGIKVPEQVGIVGFDDIYMAKLMEPELTTIRQPNYEMGYRAAEMLIRVLEGMEGDQHVVLDTKLVIRKTTMKKGESR